MNRRKFINRLFAFAAGTILTLRLHGNSGKPGTGSVPTIRIGITNASEDVIALYYKEIISKTGYDLSSPVRTEECKGPGGFIRRTDFAGGLTIFSGTCYPAGVSLNYTI
jgi:hypothetical protein